jgi:cation:H+ antiporter
MVGEVAEVAEVAEVDAATGHADEDRRRREPGRALLLVLLGLLGMVAGGYLAVRGAEGLVQVFGATESVIGLTVLALATSAEMIALVLAAHRRGVTEVALAAAVGSVAYNATVSLGLAAMVDPLLLGRGSPVLTVGVVTAALPLLLLLGRRRGHLPRPLGVLLVAAYVVSIGWLFTL